MTIQQAKLIRDQYLFLIGKKAKYFDAEITFVLVCPNDYMDFIKSFFQNNPFNLNNDAFLENYQSERYFVKIVYNTAFEDLAIDDVSEYYSYK